MSGGGWIVGIDGGGTKTEALIATRDGQIIGRGFGGSSNPNFASLDEVFTSLRSAVWAAREQAGEGSISAAAVCVPAARGIISAEETAAILGFSQARILLEGDDRSTFWGALGRPFGVVVLAGTGSFVRGQNRSGESLSVGGWGPILGDEGSGFAIGKAAIQAAIREYEDSGSVGAFGELALRHFQIDHLSRLCLILYRNPDYQRRISALVPGVLELAQEGNSTAIRTLAQAAKNLADLAGSVIRRLRMDDQAYDLALTGGLRRLGSYFLEPFEQAVRSSFRFIQIRPPLFSPAVGAVILALELAGIPLKDQILENLAVTQSFEYPREE